MKTHKKKGIINKILLKRNLGLICLFTAFFASFYYPIGAVLIIAMGVPSTPVNIGIKLVIAIFALILIIVGLLNKRKEISFPKPVWIVLCFWALYSLRLIYDLNRGITFSGYPNEMVYGFAFGAILMPIIAIVLWREQIDAEKLPMLAFIFFAVANLMIFATIIVKVGGFQFEMFLIRPHLESGNKAQKANIINPIQISFYGEMLALTSMYMLMIAKKTKIWLFLPFFAFGTAMLLLGASRGPFVSFILCALVMIFYRYRISKSRVVLAIKYVFVVSASILVFSQFFSSKDFMMLGRMKKFTESRTEDKKEYRDYQFASAWQDFLDSPVYGKQFVGTYDLFYPHNIILEVLMATGLIGGALFGYFLMSVFLKMWRSFQLKDDKIFFITIITLPIVLGSLFSGCLFQSVDLWLMMILLITIPMQRRKFKRTVVPSTSISL